MASPANDGTRPNAAIISASDFRSAPFVCPRCKSGRVVMLGRLERGFRETYVSDENHLPKGLGAVIDESFTQTYTHLLCGACNTVVQIFSDEMVRLIQENIALKEQVEQFEASRVAVPKSHLTIH